MLRNLKKSGWFKYRFTAMMVCAGFGVLFSLTGAGAFAGKTDLKVVTPGIVVELICQGKFDVAAELIKFSDEAQEPMLVQLSEIIRDYQQISKDRLSIREDAYKEQLDQLNKYHGNADTNDVNDVNNIPKILATIARAKELATQPQWELLRSDPFVKQTIRKAVNKASEFESEGKWLDAYISCYSGLQEIDKDNVAYSDYAKKLLEKAGIVASFQDSPCETSKERYTGVKKQMFVKAIDILNYTYVNVIDYRQMAIEAVTRCELLAEVMTTSFDEITKSSSEVFLGKDGQGLEITQSSGKVLLKEDGQDFFTPPDNNQLLSWSLSLSKILHEIDSVTAGISKDSFLNIFNKILKINTTTVQLPEQVLIAQFAEAALASLDPYTIMVWPKQVQDFEKAISNQFTGIGIHISKAKGILTAASLLPDTPAYYSGLDAGDIIEKVDGVETRDMTTSCAVKLITGPAGTKVTLTIRRLGDENTEDKIMDITITRDVIIVPTVNGWKRTESGRWLFMLDENNRIGYIRISSFSERTTFDFENALIALEAAGMRGLILDLRNNPGGLLKTAIKIADKFIKKGTIVSQRPRFGNWSFAPATKRGTHPEYPIVILINSYSASASEIVAGALADDAHERATLVGQRTHGKGSVQTINNRPGGGGQLKYTMAYYYLPSGQRVENRDVMKKLNRQDWGVAPDVEVKLKYNERIKALDIQWDNLVLAKADHDNGTKPLKKHSIAETLEADPQLATGVLVLKSKLIGAGFSISSLN